MKSIGAILYLIILLSIGISNNIVPLSQRYFHSKDMDLNYSRGTYLIVLSDTSLKKILIEEETGDFIKFKQTQGYDVKVVDYNWVGGTSTGLRFYLKDYSQNIDPMLEYVLLIGDVNGYYEIPPFTISSYNENDLDVTDYPYTFFNNNDKLHPDFFIGRWSIRNEEDLRKIKFRSIQYITMDYISDPSYLNNALLVAGNYSDTPPWPVTPVMTSKWLMDKLNQFGYNTIDKAFFHQENQQVNNPLIESAWNNGVGIINYRGWGDANGWHKPYFHREAIEALNNGLKMPVVMSFVCNTGDFGNNFSGVGLNKCFGEALITGGSINNPKGAVAMVGPSDLDTDTRFNNVMCAAMWDELLEGRIPELAPALHAGKQALIKEFGDLEVNGTNIVEFYHHIYGVLGDPSLPVWLIEPKNMLLEVESNTSLFVSISIKDEDSNENIRDVVGALLHEGKLISKGLSNSAGQLIIEFPSELANSEITLYFNKSQYNQKDTTFTLQQAVNSESSPQNDYEFPPQNSQYRYDVNHVEYNWIEINSKGDNLNLTDDSIAEIDVGFDFMYYGETYNKLTVCSNGWVSFLPCLNDDNQGNGCNPLPYFYNHSITSPLGPYGMVAPFFDDLDDNEGNEPFNVYSWTKLASSDHPNDSLIVQWDDVANGQHDEDCIIEDANSCVRHTFQLILESNTSSINGNITFQYKSIVDVDDHGSTVGIESPDKNVGTEYAFNYTYHENGVSLRDSLAIKFSEMCNGPIDNNACDCTGNVADCADVCGGSAVVDECGVCSGDGSSCVVGCTYSGAENYNSEATITDGSCIIKGCTDLYSINYNASANNDDGSCTTSLSINHDLIPQHFLFNSYPNPFNPIVKISLSVPEMEFIIIDIVDIQGRKLTSLANENYYPGYYALTWDASNYSSGVYFVTLIVNNTRFTKKILLLK